MPSHAVDIAWIPLGAGARTPTVRWSGRAYERLRAWREDRAPAELVHAALLVLDDGQPWTVEVAPAWGPGSGGSGVCGTGPVGARALGLSRVFRYEVRRCRDGVVPDLPWAFECLRLTEEPARARAVLAAVADVPRLTWGRDEHHHGDMWSSNSVVAWALVRAGLDPGGAGPPPGTRAPGWTAGCAEAATRAGPRPR